MLEMEKERQGGQRERKRKKMGQREVERHNLLLDWLLLWAKIIFLLYRVY